MTQSHTRRGFTQRCNPKGFTLIELLVVVLIIGILAAVAIPQYQKAADKSSFLQLMLVGEKIYQAQQLYFLENGRYASTAGEVNADVPEGYNVQHFGGNDGVLVYKTFYCHTNSSAQVLCWLKKPSVGFFRNKTRRDCVLCRSTNRTIHTLPRAESICQAVSGKSLPSDGDCVYVSLP